jgi:hypothetical protein
MSDPETTAALKALAESNEKIGHLLAKMNSEPLVDNPLAANVQTIEDQATPAPPQARKYITPEERLLMGQTVKAMDDNEIANAVSAQVRKAGNGIPLETWLNTAGFSAQIAFDGITSQLDPEIQKAIDTTAATALIRQDLEPFLYEVFVRLFPAYDRMGKEPANGLTHAWNQITDYGDAVFMSELGTVTDDKSTYVRQTTNVAILATRRGLSLKSKFAVIAGGMNYNPEQLELQGGLRSIAHRMQTQIFEGNAADSGGTASNELGLYDENAFTGLRQLLDTSDAKFVDPATAPTVAGNFRRVMDQCVLPIIQSGGRPSISWSHPSEKITFDEQQDANFRVLAGQNQTTLGVGVVADRINTVAGPVPWAVVPGDSISSYTYAGAGGNGVSNGDTVRDIYVLDEPAISLPFLGTPGPTVLEIPIGISGQLTHLYIVFLMNGLAIKVSPWHNKIRVKVA